MPQPPCTSRSWNCRWTIASQAVPQTDGPQKGQELSKKGQEGSRRYTKKYQKNSHPPGPNCHSRLLAKFAAGQAILPANLGFCLFQYRGRPGEKCCLTTKGTKVTICVLCLLWPIPVNVPLPNFAKGSLQQNVSHSPRFLHSSEGCIPCEKFPPPGSVWPGGMIDARLTS